MKEVDEKPKALKRRSKPWKRLSINSRAVTCRSKRVWSCSRTAFGYHGNVRSVSVRRSAALRCCFAITRADR